MLPIVDRMPEITCKPEMAASDGNEGGAEIFSIWTPDTEDYWQG
jgi:hypothetical protein